MKKILVSLLFLCLSACGQTREESIHRLNSLGDEMFNGHYKSQELLVRFYNPHDVELLSSYAVEITDVLLDGTLAVIKTDLPLPGLRQELLNHEEIEYIEPNRGYFPTQAIRGIPNDTFFGIQWWLDDGVDLSTSKNEHINIQSAWDRTTGDSEIKIGLIDTGVFKAHPDLQDNIAEGGYDFVDGDTDANDEVIGHGTKVMGIMAASSNNGEGITGICWNISVVPYRLFGPQLFSDAVIRATDDAVKNGVRVINASFGATGEEAYSQSLYDRISKLEGEGVIWVAAAGNESLNLDETPFYPPSYNLPAMIVVGASNMDGEMPAFSNWSPNIVDLVAPGQNMVTTNFNITNMDLYIFDIFGTSLSAPIVTGTIGLLYSRNPDASWLNIKKAILATVDESEAYAGKVGTGGRINVGHAMDWLDENT